MKIQNTPNSDIRQWRKERLKPCPEDPNVLIDPNSVHLEDGKPIAYLKDRLDAPTMRRQAFDQSPFLYSVGSGTLTAWAGHLAMAATGGSGLGYLLGGAAGAAVSAFALEGIAETRQDRAQCLRIGLVRGLVAGVAGASLGPLGTTVAGAGIGALTTPI